MNELTPSEIHRAICFDALGSYKGVETVYEAMRIYAKQENEAVYELLDSQVKANCGIANIFCEVKESRDELLEGLKDARLLCQYLSKHEKTFNDDIERAKALKKKEETK